MRFKRHSHRLHQLAWASSGTLSVDAGTQRWVLPTARALWIPSGVQHEAVSAGASSS
ncbi:AraC family ligand binding domain-containing protein [Streptomyces nigrescens]|uniref:AraC family ligand binding domain-containing protein n=1 Tax=Streptomyces nigrescens TaxID=1920 RepID=UPI00346CB06C